MCRFVHDVHPIRARRTIADPQAASRYPRSEGNYDRASATIMDYIYEVWVTHGPIPNVEVWSTTKHEELDHNFTQSLTVYGCFRVYLHQFWLEDDTIFPTYRLAHKDVEHVFFPFPTLLGQHVCPETITDKALASKRSGTR